jgi:hypothetical protein
VACLDELEIEQILLAWHGWKFGGHGAAVNGEDGGSRLARGGGMV